MAGARKSLGRGERKIESRKGKRELESRKGRKRS